MGKDWKIYTRTGDRGETSLIGGRRVPKYHLRIEAYGTLDELNSFVGHLRDQVADAHIREILLEVQDRLFTAESLLAVEPEKKAESRLPELNSSDVALLENEIDQMNAGLAEIKSFLLPGGHPLVSLCHICRTVCRRAERHTLKLASEEEGIDELVIMYLNRLSDYFFVLARKIAKDQEIPDLKWEPRV